MEENCIKTSSSTIFLMEYCLLYHSYTRHSSFHLFPDCTLLTNYVYRKQEKARKSEHYGDRIGWIFNTPLINSRMCSKAIKVNNAPENGNDMICFYSITR